MKNMFVSDCYNVNEKGHLTISGCDTVELAEKYGFRQTLLELAEKKCHSAQNTAF